MKREILHSHDAKSKKDKKFSLVIHVNNNMMRSEIKCAYRINFTKPHIGSLLGFSRDGAAIVAQVGCVDKSM